MQRIGHRADACSLHHKVMVFGATVVPGDRVLKGALQETILDAQAPGVDLCLQTHITLDALAVLLHQVVDLCFVGGQHIVHAGHFCQRRCGGAVIIACHQAGHAVAQGEYVEVAVLSAGGQGAIALVEGQLQRTHQVEP